ncbi:MAG: hypothetical protein RLZZ630_253, partial [Bacteroidota bacterium]
YYSEKGFLEKTIPLHNGVEEGIAKEFAEDGRIITLTTYKSGFFVKQEKINRTDKFGFKQGPWKEFYPSGVVKEDGYWKDDKKNGVFRWLGPEGIVIRMEIWKNGELSKDELANVKLDIKRDYHNNGRPKSSVNLINGLREGVYREFDNKGNTTGSRLYDKDRVIAEGGTVDPQGRQQGSWKYFYEDGKLRMEGTYVNGERSGVWSFYYPNSRLQQQGAYVANKPEGNWSWFYPDGKILREENYKKGKEDGRMVEYDEAGNTIAEGNMTEGLREGPWKYKNGQYIAQGNYVNGLEDGDWKQYYSNGKLAFEGEYFEGQENGVHKYYFPDGSPREERRYRLGLKEGDWKVWDEDGQLVLTTTYERGEVKKMEGVKMD